MLSFFRGKQNLPNLSNPALIPKIEKDLLSLANALEGPFSDYMEEQRQTLTQLKTILSKDYFKFEELKINPEKFFSTIELFTLAAGGSWGTLAGVQLFLAGGGIMNLMDPNQGRKLLEKIQTGELLGCFCMTEVGHGSNVPGLETVAIYDPTTQEFIIDNVKCIYKNKQFFTINEENEKDANTAAKLFIGNAGNADFGIVFAQLGVPGEDGQLVPKGVHAFYVPFTLNGLRALYPDATPEMLSKIEFHHMGEKFGLNGIGNFMVRFHQARIPLKNMMMHKLATLSPQGVYTKLVDSPLMHLYSAIKFGRTFIASSSASFTAIMFVMGHHLRKENLLSQQNMNTNLSDVDKAKEEVNDDFFDDINVVLPGIDHLAKWASCAVALTLAKNKLTKDIHTLDDAIATGMKVFSTTLTEQIYDELHEMIPGYHPAKARLLETFRDWVASCTYEGDNGVIPQKVIGDQLLHLQKISKGFNFSRDMPFILEVLDALKGIVWINTGDEICNMMKQQTWTIILGLSQKLSKIMNSSSSKKEKGAEFSETWNELQLLINALSNVYSALFTLNEFKANIGSSEVMQHLYIAFRNQVFLEYYLEIFKHLDDLSTFAVIPLKGAKLQFVADHEPPSGELIKQLKAGQREAYGKIAISFNKIITAFTGDNPTFHALLKQKLLSFRGTYHHSMDGSAAVKQKEEVKEEEVVTEVRKRFKAAL